MTTTQNSTTQQASTFEVGTTVHVAPDTLVMTRNIRTGDLRPGADFVKSIADLGVLQPIVAVITTTGDALMVRFGHRRTLAAIAAKRPTVPVYVAGVDGEAKTDEILRVLSQRDENNQREGLTTADEIGVVEQLTAFGLSAAQITKQARIKRADVDQALSVSKSKIARKAADRYADLTLDQAAAVAEFESQPETVKALIVAAHEGQFDHTVQRLRDDRARAEARDQARSALTEQGVRIIDRPNYDAKAKRLRDLYPTADAKSTYGDKIEQHAECPGHVAWIGYVNRRDDQGSLVADIEYGCENPGKHGHQTWDQRSRGSSTKKPAAEMTTEEREQAQAARRLVIENNKAWQSAETVRREWLTTFAKAKTPPKGTGRFLATALSTDAHLIGTITGNHLAAEWLGAKHGDYGRADLSPAKSATENRALTVTLVAVLADYEADLTDRSWRDNGTNNATGRYLRFLATCGYGLSPVEKYAASSKTA